MVKRQSADEIIAAIRGGLKININEVREAVNAFLKSPVSMTVVNVKRTQDLYKMLDSFYPSYTATQNGRCRINDDTLFMDILPDIGETRGYNCPLPSNNYMYALTLMAYNDLSRTAFHYKNYEDKLLSESRPISLFRLSKCLIFGENSFYQAPGQEEWEEFVKNVRPFMELAVADLFRLTGDMTIFSDGQERVVKLNDVYDQFFRKNDEKWIGHFGESRKISDVLILESDWIFEMKEGTDIRFSLSQLWEIEGKGENNKNVSGRILAAIRVWSIVLCLTVAKNQMSNCN